MRNTQYHIICIFSSMVMIFTNSNLQLITFCLHYSFTPLTQKVGLTGENPETSGLPQSHYTPDNENDEHLFLINSDSVWYKCKELCKLDFSTSDLNVGQSLGILLTREREFHWFVDNKWRGMVHVDDYPLDRPMWGVADVYARCKQVKADICSGESIMSLAVYNIVNTSVG